MRIAVDACCWSNRRGFGRYTRELVTRMVEEHPEHRFLLLVDAHTAAEAETAARAGSAVAHMQLPREGRVVAVPTSEPPTRAASAESSRGLLDMLRMGRAAARARPDVLFFPAVYTFFPVLAPVPVVVTFHDAIAEQHPDLVFASRGARLRWGAKARLAVATASRLLTVSASARRQIASAFGVPDSGIDVVLEGPGEGFRFQPDAASAATTRARYKLPLDVPLILCVGGLSPHKNGDGLLRALRRLAGSGAPAWHLAFVGDPQADGFLASYTGVRALAAERDLAPRVTFTGFVPDADLCALYNAATMLVMPSMSEGFGLPAMEAMACGLPVACSHRGSLPEVVGNGGLYFDPTDEASMARAVDTLLSSEALRRRLGAAGLERSRRFTWSEAARRVVAVLEEVAAGR